MPFEYQRDERLAYHLAWERQMARVEAIAAREAPNLFWLLEHDPIYTLGRSASPADILATTIPTRVTDRGGKVTYHGPGQLVGYVLRDLRPAIHAARAHVIKLEETVIRALAGLGVEARRESDNPGVWVAGEKIAALGVRIRHGVAYHGFSINRAPDLDAFAGIVPCGLAGRGVTSLEKLGSPVPRAELEARLVASFQEVFEAEWRE
ncbi:MAG: lipoyl(octanoyl) transferase LipB [Magnetococcales bacterium]|nr:lipoyl(octanoyl) transferase LipB [Magnetococcales bacterium]